MISIDREKGYIVLSRCDYLYRNGKLNNKDYQKMGDGDIIIPLPTYMIDKTYDYTQRTDGQNAVKIIEAIQFRLKKKT
jgi:hypothetical protein